jgi:hypothetical protein
MYKKDVYKSFSQMQKHHEDILRHGNGLFGLVSNLKGEKQ